MPQVSPQTVAIIYDSDVGTARRAAKAMAESLGFESAAAEEIALAVTELATNLFRHAHGGKLTLTPLAVADRVGLEVLSQDSGPGIPNVEQALTNGYSTIGSRGAGLGAINRLMDEFDVTSRPGAGTRILCRKWRRDYGANPEPCPLSFGVATRPRTFGAPNGDGFVIKQWARSALVGIIDGLGHGQFAHRAASTARQYVETHFDQPLDQLFRGTGRAARATRGVVMALARFDWGLGRMCFASVGNIETRVFPSSAEFKFPVRRGVIGLNAPSAKVVEHPWPLDNTMVLHSDGLRSHWGLDDFPELTRQTPAAAAEQLLRALAREQDDATVLVVGGRPDDE
jgi:anti-sigma regulatory factor (Ser/Thr protein kinase)